MQSFELVPVSDNSNNASDREHIKPEMEIGMGGLDTTTIEHKHEDQHRDRHRAQAPDCDQ